MIKNKEYVMSVTNFRKPKIVEDKSAMALYLTRLLLLMPGSDPLHPDMGVGIINYRYGINTLSDLKQRIKNQIDDWLPASYANAEVKLTITPDKLLNVQIKINDTVFIYDSSQADQPISLGDLKVD